MAKAFHPIQHHISRPSCRISNYNTTLNNSTRSLIGCQKAESKAVSPNTSICKEIPFNKRNSNNTKQFIGIEIWA